jgi:hypothetical protein
MALSRSAVVSPERLFERPSPRTGAWLGSWKAIGSRSSDSHGPSAPRLRTTALRDPARAERRRPIPSCRVVRQECPCYAPTGAVVGSLMSAPRAAGIPTPATRSTQPARWRGRSSCPCSAPFELALAASRYALRQPAGLELVAKADPVGTAMQGHGLPAIGAAHETPGHQTLSCRKRTRGILRPFTQKLAIVESKRHARLRNPSPCTRSSRGRLVASRLLCAEMACRSSKDT